MKNILKIIKGDYRKLRYNIVAWAIIIGMIVVPSLYTWFNLQAAWDPYSKTGELNIALASSDEGYEGELLPVSVNLGETLISDIRADDSFNWVITDKEDAIEGTKSGEYYAAVVLPKDFSRDMMSIFSEKAEAAELTYYVNEKKNAVAPMLTTKGASGIQQQIDELFAKEITELAVRSAKAMTEEGNIDFAKALAGNLAETVRDTQNVIGASANSVYSLSSATGTMDSMLDGTSDFAENTRNVTKAGRELSDTADKDINTLINQLDGHVNKLQAFLEQAEAAGMPELDGVISKVEALKGDLGSIKGNLKNLKNSSDSSLDDIDKIAVNTNKISQSAEADLKNLNKALKETGNLLNGTYSELNEIANKLEEAEKSGDMKEIEKVLANSTEEISSFVASPLQIERHAVYPVENYGSALTPFYASLAIWVGALLLVALMSVSLEESRKRELDNLKEYQVYLGRYCLFGIISILQTLLVCLGNLWYMDIQCERPLLFIIAALATSIVFSCIMYTLVASFGNIGKAISVIILIVQVAGTGGVFPIEATPHFFRACYPLMPFKYSMTAIREAIAGTYGSVYLMSLGGLAAFLVLCLIVGLLLRKPLIKMNEGFARNVEKTKVM